MQHKVYYVAFGYSGKSRSLLLRAKFIYLPVWYNLLKGGEEIEEL